MERINMIEIVEKVTIFEKEMTDYAKDNNIEINRLMLTICDDIKEHIKNGKLELLKSMTRAGIDESLNSIRSKANG